MAPDAHDLAQLHSWRAEGSAIFDQYQRMMAHPALPAAGQALAGGMLAIADSDDALDSVFKDAGRYVAAMCAYYLHIIGGLTLPALKAACARSQMLSPGRTRALLMFLLHLGYFELVAESAGGRPAVYRPTPGFVAVWRDHLRVALEAAVRIEPGVGRLIGRLDEPGVLETVTRIQAEELLSATVGADVDIPFYSIFMNRHAGTQIVWSLMTGAKDSAFLSEEPIPLSVTGTAKRFQVSRIHVRRMLDDAERAGLLRELGDGTVLLLDDARLIIRFHYALQLVHLLTTSSKTLAEIGAWPCD